MTASVAESSTKNIAVGSVQAIHAMLSMAYSFHLNVVSEWSPLSTQLGSTRVGHLELSKSDISDFDRERAGVRGYGLSRDCDPSPGFLASRQIRPLPVGEVKRSPEMRFDRTITKPCRARNRARCNCGQTRSPARRG